MKVQFKHALITILMILVTTPSFGQTVVMHADFNQDTVGEQPSTTPSGDPAGDYLHLSTTGGSISVESTFADLIDQPVIVSRTQSGSIGLQFWLDPDLRDCDVYHISWRSLVDRYVGFAYLSMSAPNYTIMSIIEYRSGGGLYARGINNPLSVGYLPNTSQFFEATVDLANGLLDISVDGQPDPQAQDIDIGSAMDGLRFIGLSFGLSDYYAVAMDDVHITGEGCTNVPVFESSFGAMKANYE